MRDQSSLSFRFPGIMAGSRFGVFSNRPSLISRRRPAFRLLASGPWQAKQLSDRIGRMSRLYRTADSAAFIGVTPVPSNIIATEAIPNAARRDNEPILK